MLWCLQKVTLLVVFGVCVLLFCFMFYLPLSHETCNFSVPYFRRYFTEGFAIYIFADAVASPELERKPHIKNAFVNRGGSRKPIIKPIPQPSSFSDATKKSFDELSLREKYNILKQDYDADKELLNNSNKNKSKRATIYDLELSPPQHSGGLIGGVKKEVTPSELDMNVYEIKKLRETTHPARISAVDKLSSNMDPETLNILGKGATVAGNILSSMIGGTGGPAVGNAINLLGQATAQRAEKMETAGKGKYMNYLTGFPCYPAPDKHWCLPEPVTVTSTYPPTLYQLRKHAERKAELEAGRRRNEEYLQEMKRNPFVDPIDEMEFENLKVDSTDDDLQDDASEIAEKQILVESEFYEQDYPQPRIYNDDDDEIINNDILLHRNAESDKISFDRIKMNSVGDIMNIEKKQNMETISVDRRKTTASSNLISQSAPVETRMFDNNEVKNSMELFAQNGILRINDERSNFIVEKNEIGNLSVSFVSFADFDLPGNSTVHTSNYSSGSVSDKEKGFQAGFMANHNKWRQRKPGKEKEKPEKNDIEFSEGDEDDIYYVDGNLKKLNNVILVGQIPKKEISVFTPDELSLTAPTLAPPTPEELVRMEKEKKKQERREIRIERAVNQYQNTYADELRKATTYQDYKVQDSTYSGAGVWQNEVRLRVKEEKRKDKETKKNDYLKDMKKQKIELEAEKHRLTTSFVKERGKDHGEGRFDEKDEKISSLGKRTMENIFKGEKEESVRDTRAEKRFRANTFINEKRDTQTSTNYNQQGETAIDEYKNEKDILTLKDLNLKNVLNIKHSLTPSSLSNNANADINIRQRLPSFSNEKNSFILSETSLPLSLAKNSQMKHLSHSTSYLANTPIEALLDESLQFISPTFSSSLSMRGFSFAAKDEEKEKLSSLSSEELSKHTSRNNGKCLFDCQKSKVRRISSILSSFDSLLYHSRILRENDVLMINNALRFLRADDKNGKTWENIGRENDNQRIGKKLRAGELSGPVKKIRAIRDEKGYKALLKKEVRVDGEFSLLHESSDETKRKRGGGRERNEEKEERVSSANNQYITSPLYVGGWEIETPVNEVYSSDNSSKENLKTNRGENDNLNLLRQRREIREKQNKNAQGEGNDKYRRARRRTEELNFDVSVADEGLIEADSHAENEEVNTEKTDILDLSSLSTSYINRDYDLDEEENEEGDFEEYEEQEYYMKSL